MSTIVYVEYVSGSFQWGKSTVSMVPLSTPIDTQSNVAVTYEFIRTGTNAIWYKLPPSSPTGTSLPTSNGPTVLVKSGRSATISFSSSSGGDYYTGTVSVSGDGFHLAGGGGGGGAGAGADHDGGQGHDEHGEGHGYGHGQGHEDD